VKSIPLYPLRFEPIYQYRLWGGRRLSTLPSAPLPGDGPIGEAWPPSDRDDHAEAPFTVGLEGTPRVLACIDGDGHVEHDGAIYAIDKGGGQG